MWETKERLNYKESKVNKEPEKEEHKVDGQLRDQKKDKEAKKGF